MAPSVQHIVSDPNILAGKPRIAGTRLAVRDIVAHHLYRGLPPEVIAAKWHVPLAAVHAALAYYYDHKQEIEHSFQEDEAFVKELREERRTLLGGAN